MEGQIGEANLSIKDSFSYVSRSTVLYGIGVLNIIRFHAGWRMSPLAQRLFGMDKSPEKNYEENLNLSSGARNKVSPRDAKLTVCSKYSLPRLDCSCRNWNDDSAATIGKNPLSGWRKDMAKYPVLLPLQGAGVLQNGFVPARSCQIVMKSIISKVCQLLLICCDFGM